MLVEVYWNLHKDCYSVRSRQGDTRGRVIAHLAHITLFNAEFRVSKAGRERVLRERRKNVHAVVRGRWLEGVEGARGSTIPVFYNPYKYESFVDANAKPIYEADMAVLTSENGKASMGAYIS